MEMAAVLGWIETHAWDGLLMAMELLFSSASMPIFIGMKRATVAGDAGDEGRGSRHGRYNDENQAKRGGVA
jgi:hypothetical protein